MRQEMILLPLLILFLATLVFPTWAIAEVDTTTVQPGTPWLMYGIFSGIVAIVAALAIHLCRQT